MVSAPPDHDPPPHQIEPLGIGDDQDRPAGGERDLLWTRPARLRLGAVGIELAEDGEMLVQHYPPSSRPRILRSWKSGLARTHQTRLPKRDHDSVINDTITQNASNESSISTYISRLR